MKKVHTLAIDQKEDAKHGESFFPVQKYITNLSSEYMGVTNHWHEEAELTLITSGKCIYKIDVNTIELIENRMKQFSKMLMKKHGEITIESY